MHLFCTTFATAIHRINVNLTTSLLSLAKIQKVQCSQVRTSYGDTLRLKALAPQTLWRRTKERALVGTRSRLVSSDMLKRGQMLWERSSPIRSGARRGVLAVVWSRRVVQDVGPGDGDLNGNHVAHPFCRSFSKASECIRPSGHIYIYILATRIIALSVSTGFLLQLFQSSRLFLRRKTWCNPPAFVLHKEGERFTCIVHLLCRRSHLRNSTSSCTPSLGFRYPIAPNGEGLTLYAAQDYQ